MSRFQKGNWRKALGTGHILDKGKPARLEEIPEIEVITCEHDSYCQVRPLLKKAHCSKDYAKTCQTAKFYLKYGKDYNALGVGS